MTPATSLEVGSITLDRQPGRSSGDVRMTEPLTFTFADDGAIPNSKLPLLVYRQSVPADPAAIERIFTTNRWPAAWRDAVHPFHHFHSDAHEALGVASGSAKVRFGGPAGRYWK